MSCTGSDVDSESSAVHHTALTQELDVSTRGGAARDLVDQLQALGYDTTELSASPAFLVKTLLHDLLRAKGAALEAARRVEQQSKDARTAVARATAAFQESKTFEQQASTLQSQLASQSRMHADEQQKLQTQLQRAETVVASLQGAAQRTAAQIAALEDERDGLRSKIRTLVAVTSECEATGVSLEAIDARIEMPYPVLARPAPTAEISLGLEGIDLVAMAASKIETLENELKEERKRATTQEKLADAAQDAVNAKDAELSRLRDEVTALKATGAGANRNTLVQLSRHADELTAELDALRQRAPGADALAKAEEARRAAEKRAEAAVAEKTRIATEVSCLRADMTVLQKELESGAAAKKKVAQLRTALDECHTKRDRAMATVAVAEGRAAELQERLDRRETALQRAQARCRSAEAELHRLRQLQSLKNCARNESNAPAALEQAAPKEATTVAAVEVQSLQARCATMTQHLQQAMKLQEEALAAAEVAAVERDDFAQEVLLLRSQLEVSQRELEDAARAVATLSQCMLPCEDDTKSNTQSSPKNEKTSTHDEYRHLGCTETPGSTCTLTAGCDVAEDIAASAVCHGRATQAGNHSSEPQVLESGIDSHSGDNTQAPARCSTGSSPMHVSSQEGSRTAPGHCEAAGTTTSSMSVANNSRDALQDQDHNTMSQRTMTTATKTTPRPPPGTHVLLDDVEVQLAAKTQECQALAAAGQEADAALQDCVEQLRTAATEVQRSRAAAATASADLHERETELQAARRALEALRTECAELRSRIEATEALEGRNADAVAAALAAEREAAANDFHALRCELQGLSRQYQEAAAAMVGARRERDEAAEQAQLAATQAAFHEQAVRAKEEELEESAVAYRRLAEEHRRLQGTVVELQRKLTSQACDSRIDSERAHAALQRRLAAAEGSAAVLEARLTQAQNEAAELRQHVQSSHSKVEELEGLLAQERAAQFGREEAIYNQIRSAQASSEEDEALEEKLQAIEAECRELQEELERVRNCANDRRSEMLAEIAQLQAMLHEERRQREGAQTTARNAVEEARRARPRSGGAEAMHGALRQLHNIADGLQGLGVSFAVPAVT